MNIKKILGIVVAVAAVGFVLYSNTENNSKDNSDKFIVAMNMPLTGTGNAFKRNVPNAFKMGFYDELDRLGLSKDNVVFDIQDNATTPQNALSIYRLQEMKGFDVYHIGMTNEIVAVAPFLNKANKPNFYDMTGAVTLRRGNNQTMRILCNMNMEAALLEKFMKDKKAKSMLYLAENILAQHEQYNEIIEPMCKKNGWECKKVYFDSKERDFHTFVYKLKQEKQDVIFAAGMSGSYFQLARELYLQDMVHNDVITSIAFLPFLQDTTVDNKMKAAFYAMADDNSLPGKVAKSAEFRKKFKEKYNTEALFNDAYAYDEGVLVARAYAKHGKHITAEDIIAETPYDGASGRIVMDPTTRDLATELTLAKVNAEGKLEAVQTE